MDATMDQVMAAIYPEEPDYVAAAEVGAPALPFLTEIVLGDDPMLASKAAYLAGVIGGPGSVDVLEQAAGRPAVTVRIAAASAVAIHEGQDVREILLRLLRDVDVNVRRMALRSTAILKLESLAPAVAELARHDPSSFIRELAVESLQQIKQ